jgi:hypothetical protein
MKKEIVGIFVSMLLFATALVVAAPIESSNYSSSTKWEQLPDETENGIDIRIDDTDGIMRTVADDFECTTTEPILDVHFWGSWKGDEKGQIRVIHLSIHEDIPAEQSPTGYSMPGELLWEMDFYNYDETVYADVPGEWWWDPYTGELIPMADYVIWQYDIYIDPDVAFVQQGTQSDPIVYWLDIYVKLDPAVGGEFGWKTSVDHWNDDAVYYQNDDPYWFELIYPPNHPYHGESIDMAFRITGEDEPKPAICCKGVLSWTKVELGQTLTGTFDVINCGETGSFLDWEVTSWPAWGTWTFSPMSGTGLPAGSFTTVTVTVVAPNTAGAYTGEVVVCNKDDSTDCCKIPVTLKTPRSKTIFDFPLLQQFLELHPNMFPILRTLMGL